MAFFARLSPVRAIVDLRQFLLQRQRHELIFLGLAMVITTLILAGFMHDSRVEPPYKRQITYFKSWSADRTDAQIMRDQAIDFAVKTRRDAMLEKKQQDAQESYKKYDRALQKWGI